MEKADTTTAVKVEVGKNPAKSLPFRRNFGEARVTESKNDHSHQCGSLDCTHSRQRRGMSKFTSAGTDEVEIVPGRARARRSRDWIRRRSGAGNESDSRRRWRT